MFWGEGIVCRLCLFSDSHADRFEELLESDVSEISSLSTKIFSALKWKVCREDRLPNFVCKECIQKLNFIIFCNTWSSRIAMDFEEIQSLFSLYCKQKDNTARSTLVSMFEKRNATNTVSTLVNSKFNNVSSFVFQVESILSKTENTHLCFSENENIADCISLALELPNMVSSEDIDKYCSSPAVDDETQYPSNIHELHGGTEVSVDLKLTSGSEETSNQLTNDCSTGTDINIRPSDMQLSCPECQVSFSKRSLLWKHLVGHEGALDKYQCPSCRRKFIFISELNRHVRAHKGLKPYACNKCDKFFSQKNLLDNHMNWHEGRKGHLCDICGECLSSGPNLKAHISNQHSGEKKKPFKCVECGKCFVRSHHLENHTIIHKKYRPHLCTTCGATFKRSSQLQEHETVHSGEKQHECDKCNKCFRTKRVLNIHKWVHSEIKPHQCSQCSKSFVRRGGLLAHLKGHKS